MKKRRHLLDIIDDVNDNCLAEKMYSYFKSNPDFKQKIMKAWHNPNYRMSEVEKRVVEMILEDGS